METFVKKHPNLSAIIFGVTLILIGGWLDRPIG
jgi:hypothetical protein